MKIQTFSLSLVILFCFLVLPGCISFHPLGMSDSEWNSLTPEQKITAREKQAQLDADKEQARADRAAAEKAENARRYERAMYGDIITVVITGGTMDIHGKRREYEPIAFDLIRGESRRIDIIRKGKRHYKDSAVVRLSEDGRTFYFDDEQRESLILVDDAWEYGKTYRVQQLKNRNTNPRDIEIKIRYRPVQGKREQVIIVR